MKKYKHKKTGEIATYKDGILKIERCCVEIGVEPSSKFWEEVIEKDYEILSFIGLNTGLTWLKHKDGLFSLNENLDKSGIQSAEYLLVEGCKIKSVKRLSDGEVFSIGDEVQYNAQENNTKYPELLRPYKIEKFYIDSLNRIVAHGYNKKDNVTNSACIVESKNFRKAKPVLFTTEDGVDIYEGDRIYTISPDFSIGFTGKLNFKPTVPCFSTKEKAEEYILMNKPCLSINDVFPKFAFSWQLYDLKELVKSKL